MRKFFVKLICCFIPSRKIRHKIRERFSGKNDIHGNNNKIIIIDENGAERLLHGTFPGIRFNITGNNNTVKIHTPIHPVNTIIELKNDNCYVEFGPSRGDFSVRIECICGKNNKIVIGKQTTIGSAYIACTEQSSCFIGEDCMFSGLIRIYCADGHSVIDAETDEILNEVTEPLQIGNHVWMGEGVRVTKNARIHDNCIIAGGAVVCKDYKESGVVIAGNPGKIVKKNITWSRLNPYYLKYCLKQEKKDKKGK